MLRGLLAMALMACASELFARYWLGLGDPPLSMADSDIEYLFQPNQHCRRFGNTITYNTYSMRGTPDFPKTKTDPREFRVMVFGDSVINGGSQTDDRELATTLLQRRLAEQLQRPVIVGNISAGSWGPENLLAYARRHGFFSADVVVVVLNSDDILDIRTYEPVVGTSPDFPDRRPVSALGEMISRYLLPRIRGGSMAQEATALPDPNAHDRSISALRTLIQEAKESGAEIIVVQHLRKDELRGNQRPGHSTFGNIVAEDGTRLLQLGPSFEQSFDRGDDPYRDVIHPNEQGQSRIAELLLSEIK